MTNEMFGARLRAFRKEKGMTIEQLAEQVGLSPNYLGDVERGKKFPSTATLIRLVNELDVSSDELLRDEVKRADYLIDAEISNRMQGLTPKQRTAVMKILDGVLEALPLLGEEKE